MLIVLEPEWQRAAGEGVRELALNPADLSGIRSPRTKGAGGVSTDGIVVRVHWTAARLTRLLPATMQAVWSFGDNLLIEFAITPEDDQCRILYRVVGTGKARCVRCTEELVADLNQSGSLILTERDLQSSGGLSREELDLLVAPKGRILLSDLVLESLLDGLEEFPMCSKSCKGLCPECGHNRNLDECSCRVMHNGSLADALQKLKH